MTVFNNWVAKFPRILTVDSCELLWASSRTYSWVIIFFSFLFFPSFFFFSYTYCGVPSPHIVIFNIGRLKYSEDQCCILFVYGSTVCFAFTYHIWNLFKWKRWSVNTQLYFFFFPTDCSVFPKTLWSNSYWPLIELLNFLGFF